MIAKLLRRISAGLLSGVMIASAAVSPVSAAVVDKDNPNNYDNFAEALQLALCFYDANKCGDEVADDGYYMAWQLSRQGRHDSAGTHAKSGRRQSQRRQR